MTFFSIDNLFILFPITSFDTFTIIKEIIKVIIRKKKEKKQRKKERIQ